MQARATVKWATWAMVWRYVAGIAASLLLGWFAFVRGTRVPLLGLVDLGFHELGHLVTYVAPDVVTAAMGSITQVAVPLGLAAYFAWKRQDLMAGGVCLAWAATSAQDVSVYVGDAPFQRLQLIGGEHDWAYVLGPQHLDMLHRAGLFAGAVKGAGALLLLTGIAACGVGLARGIRVTSSAPLPARVVQSLTRPSMWK